VSKWLNAPVTRAEVLGWALAIPAVQTLAWSCTTVVRLLPGAELLADKYPDLTPTFLVVLTSLGAGGLIGLYTLGALLALGAQLGKQRPVVRIAAPVICYAFALAVNHQFLSSWQDLQKLVPSADAQANREAARESIREVLPR